MSRFDTPDEWIVCPECGSENAGLERQFFEAGSMLKSNGMALRCMNCNHYEDV